jgi:hypothetical protein
MPEEPYRYEARDRIERVTERALKLEGRIEGHEAICAQRYGQLIKELADMQETIATNSKVGLILIIMLFSLEIGRATFPALFELISKVH